MRLSALFSTALLAGFAAAALTTEDGLNSSSGIGAHVHTVIIAPIQGSVLCFVPFTVNASVECEGPHRDQGVSILEICNRTSDASFVAVERNAPFTFTQVVNDTDPVFFYSGNPSNCQKGILGIINPPSAYMASTSTAQVTGMHSAVSNSSDMAAMAAYASTQTSGTDKAAEWGQNIDFAALPCWSHVLVMENVVYMRSFLRAHPRLLKDDGSTDLGGDALEMILTKPTRPPYPPSSKGAAPRRKSNGGAASAAASSALLDVVAIAAAVPAL